MSDFISVDLEAEYKKYVDAFLSGVEHSKPSKETLEIFQSILQIQKEVKEYQEQVEARCTQRFYILCVFLSFILAAQILLFSYLVGWYF